MANRSAAAKKGWITRRGGGVKQAAKAFLGTQSLSEMRRATGLAKKINRAADAYGRFEKMAAKKLFGRWM